jgi:hypothetical protein
MRAGRYLGRSRAVRPPGPGTVGDPGWSRAVDRAAEAFFGPGAAAGAARPTSPDSGPDLDWQLVGSFVRRHGDALHVLDVDECASGRDLRERLAVLARAALGGAGKVLAR